MQKMKRSFEKTSAILSSLAVVLTLTACGHEGTGSKPTKATPKAHSNYFGKELGKGFAGSYSLDCEYSYFENNFPKTEPSNQNLVISSDGKVTLDNEIIFENTKQGSMATLTNPNSKTSTSFLDFSPSDKASDILKVSLNPEKGEITTFFKGDKGRIDCPITLKNPNYYYKNFVTTLKTRLPKAKAMTNCLVKTKDAENEYSISYRDMTIQVLDDGSIKVDDSIFPASLYPQSEFYIPTNTVKLKDSDYWGYRYTISDKGSTQRTVTLEFDAVNELIYAYRRDRDANVQYTCD